MDDSQGRPVPDVLSDPAAKGGMAPLEASYFQRCAGILGMPPKIKRFNIDVPNQWLLDSLVEKQAAVAGVPKKLNSIWKQFSQLPEDYRYMIDEHVKFHEDSQSSSGKWILLHLECIFERRLRNILGRGSRKELAGVYVVLKQNNEYKDYTIEQDGSKQKIDIEGEEISREISRRRDPNNYVPHGPPEITRRRGLYEPPEAPIHPMSHRSTQSNYVPMHHPGYRSQRSKEPGRDSAIQPSDGYYFSPLERRQQSQVSASKARRNNQGYSAKQKFSQPYENDRPSHPRTLTFADDYQHPRVNSAELKELERNIDDERLERLIGSQRAQVEVSERAMGKRKRRERSEGDRLETESYDRMRPVNLDPEIAERESFDSTRSSSHGPRPVHRVGTGQYFSYP